eukprot:1138374-Pelagomonas_calceolata.AAC.1
MKLVACSAEYQVEMPSSSFEFVDAPPEEALNAATAEPLRRSDDVAEGYEPLFPDQPITGRARKLKHHLASLLLGITKFQHASSMTPLQKVGDLVLAKK